MKFEWFVCLSLAEALALSGEVESIVDRYLRPYTSERVYFIVERAWVISNTMHDKSLTFFLLTMRRRTHPSNVVMLPRKARITRKARIRGSS